MATEVTTTQDPAKEAGWKPYRLSVRQFLAMIDAGIFPDDARIELLGGFLADQMTKYPPHNFVVGRLGRILGRILPAPWFVGEEKPVKLGRLWYPEPDIAVVRGPDDLFEKRAPQAADLGLLIEVADSSYPLDRGLKWRRYASARIALYWIVNIPDRRVEVYRDPSGRGRSAGYRQANTFGEGDEVPVVIEGQEIGRIAVGQILPRT